MRRAPIGNRRVTQIRREAMHDPSSYRACAPRRCAIGQIDTAPAVLLPAHDPQEWLRRDHGDSSIGAERQQIVIAADDILSAGGERASDDLVVVGVARHRALCRRRVFDDAGEIKEIGAERLRHLRCVAVVGLGSAVANEGSQGLGDDVGRKVEFDFALGDEPQQLVRNSSRLMAGKEGADQHARVEYDANHACGRRAGLAWSPLHTRRSPPPPARSV